jgi:hypothetical protein
VILKDMCRPDSEQLGSKTQQTSMPPVVMVLAMNKLVSTIQRYCAELAHKTDSSRHSIPTPTSVVAFATSTGPRQPLSEHDAKVLTDLFPSICGLEEGTRTEHGRKVIREYFDPAKEQDLVDFWLDEWIV